MRLADVLHEGDVLQDDPLEALLRRQKVVEALVHAARGRLAGADLQG